MDIKKQEKAFDGGVNQPYLNNNDEFVLVEMRLPDQLSPPELLKYIKPLIETGFQLDPDYKPVPIRFSGGDLPEPTAVIRGKIQANNIEKLASNDSVVHVWLDTPIEPFEEEEEEEEEEKVEQIDCERTKAHGDVHDVIKQLGIDTIWNEGIRGKGITIGIVDGGVDSQDFPSNLSPPQINDGYRDDFGRNAHWDKHGNVAAAIVKAIAPEASIFDIRITTNEKPARISTAIAGYHWAISQFKIKGTPHILTNGWGIYQESWDSAYANNPNHPFSRKVADAVNEGITVLFAAGNCGEQCPDGRCNENNKQNAGPGRSIWGANGHPQVITIGAVNPKGDWIGYSSQGPAVLDPKKPDICGVSHFRAYSDCDSGTSTACHMTAGIVALLKQKQTTLTPAQIKTVLIDTAEHSGTDDWGPRFGHGIIQPQKAIESLSAAKGQDRNERQPDVVRIKSDDPAFIDALNRMPFADVLAECMQDVWKQNKEDGYREGTAGSDLPGDQPGEAFIIHIHGPWGAGKTSVLNFLKQRLTSEENKGLNTGNGKEFWLVVDFNAWLNQRANLPWMALLDSVYRQGVRQLVRKKPLNAAHLFLCEHFWRFRYGIAPYLFAGALLLWLTALAAGLFSQSDLPKVFSQNWIKFAGNVKTFLEPAALAFAIFGILSTGIRSVINSPDGIQKGFLRSGRDPMRPIITHFKAITTIMKLPVAVFIDDLDRCECDYVIELLRGIQTIFHQCNVTFVVAADREWLRSSYEQKYETYKKAIGDTGCPLGYLFLDKLFQVSVSLPRISSEKQKAYLDSLIELKGFDKPEEMEKAERDARQLAHKELAGIYEEPDVFKKINAVKGNTLLQRAMRGVAAKRSISPGGREYNEHVLKSYVHLLESNPRSLKRLVNAYGFERAINWLSERDVNQGPLVRWTILRMRWPALANYLEKFSDKIGNVGSLKTKDDSNVENLLNNEHVKAVINGIPPDSGVLDVQSLRKILGL
ncbi:MAG: S8 family serine peptidase [Desulfosarcina sp.]|nr:S8 family serine peptidase [Desulfobacterales bacterium]